MSLDPRTRLLLLLLAVLALAVTSNVLLLAVVLSVLVLAGMLAGEEAALRRALRLVLFMAVLVFVLSVYGAGLQAALAAVLRLAAIVTASVLTFAGTSPVDLGNALVSGGVPYPAAFVLMAALQFVPVIARRAAAVYDAQRARGIPLDSGLSGLRHSPALVLPVLYQSFKLADDLAEAMESRGFSRANRTFRSAYRLQPADWIALAATTVATVLYVRAGGF
jgi:energy-coupling factor transport system permease protein